jgi:hypothetical protein
VGRNAEKGRYCRFCADGFPLATHELASTSGLLKHAVLRLDGNVTPIRVSLPTPIADALVESGDAVRPFTTRGPGAIEILNFAIEGINTGAAIVTLVGGVELYRKIARQLRELAAGRAVVLETTEGETQVLPQAPQTGPPASASAPAADAPAHELDDAIVAALEGTGKSQS